jgi:2'-5' RNA ligase
MQAKTCNDHPMAETVSRLLVALWPEAAVRDALAARQRQWRWTPRATVVPADKLHVTLHFLGNVASARVPALKPALRVAFEPFDLSLASASVWPGGIAVFETDVPPALQALHARLAQALQGFGLGVESRPYRPHVTLARKAQGSEPSPLVPLQWAVQGYALVLSAQGRYQVIERYC